MDRRPAGTKGKRSDLHIPLADASIDTVVSNALRESRYSLKVPGCRSPQLRCPARTKISFRRLDRGVAEEKFDLLQVAAILAAQLRTGPPQIMSSKVLNPDLGCGNDSGQNGPFGEQDSHSSSSAPSLGV
jgi:hypothetical protein